MHVVELRYEFKKKKDADRFEELVDAAFEAVCMDFDGETK